MRACLIAAAAAAFARAQCSVRLMNEFPAPVSLALNATVLVSFLAAHAVSGYVSIPCDTVALDVTGNGTTSVSVSFNTSSVSLTVLAGGVAGAAPVATTFEDQTAALGTGPGMIDVCNLRVINAGPVSVDFSGVTALCSIDCLKPLLATIAPLSTTDYVSMSCDSPLLSRVTFAGGGASTDRMLPLAEHGAFTLLVANEPAGAPVLTFLTDASAPDSTIPLYVGAALLVAMGALHWLVGLAIVHSGCGASLVAAATKPGGGSHDEDGTGYALWLLQYFGYDKKITAKAAAAANKTLLAGADSSSSATSGDSLSASLLGGGAAEGLAAAVTPVAAAAPASTKPKSAGRVRSIDALRGAALCFMIFVNYGGGRFVFLDHSKWNGLNLADLLFPTFVWTQGVSMAISFDAMRRRGTSPWAQAHRVAARAVKLYALGCFLNGGTDLSQWRLLGVLQYFAVSYLVVGLLEVFLRPAPPAARPAADSSSAREGAPHSAGASLNAAPSSSSSAAAASNRKPEPLPEPYEALAGSSLAASLWRDVGAYWAQWAVMLGLGALYVGLQQGLPLDGGCPTGYTGPGGLASQGQYATCTGGAHAKIDKLVFGTSHMYHSVAGGVARSSATCSDAFQCAVYDPEGMLGWISACWTTFLGLQAGRVFVHYRSLLAAAPDAAARRAAVTAYVARWAGWGLALGLLGAGLAGFSKDGGVVPINKNEWSPSFVAVMAGLDFLLLAALYLIVDVTKWWKGAPLLYVGMNSIVVYLGSELFDRMLPFRVYQSQDWADHAEALTSNVLGVLVWIAIARHLYLRKIFVNL